MLKGNEKSEMLEKSEMTAIEKSQQDILATSSISHKVATLRQYTLNFKISLSGENS